jgi:hypothetical protein
MFSVFFFFSANPFCVFCKADTAVFRNVTRLPPAQGGMVQGPWEEVLRVGNSDARDFCAAVVSLPHKSMEQETNPRNSKSHP